LIVAVLAISVAVQLGAPTQIALLLRAADCCNHHCHQGRFSTAAGRCGCCSLSAASEVATAAPRSVSPAPQLWLVPVHHQTLAAPDNALSSPLGPREHYGETPMGHGSPKAVKF